MPPISNLQARQACEDIIREDRCYNIKNNIWKSQVAIADRLLRRGLELGPAYDELYQKLHQHPHGLAAFLELVMEVAALWNPEGIARARAGRDELNAINQKIAEYAAELASLLERRADLPDHSGFGSDTFHHICDVIAAAGEKNSLYTGYVQEGMDALRTRFDLKYWPTVGEFLGALAMDASTARVEATDPVTEAATAASRASLADFVKGLFADIDENKMANHGRLPDNLTITDGTYAALITCALDLEGDATLSSDYVKGIRQRMRKSSGTF